MVLPYSYNLEVQHEVYRYIFTTRLGIRYCVYFTSAGDYFGLTDLAGHLAENGFIAGVTKMGEHEDSITKMDIRVRCTICTIITDFLTSNPQNILFMHYDSYDGKQLKRYNCFSKWFRDFNDGKFFKEDTDLIIDDVWINKLSLIIHNDHKARSIILQEFHDTKNRLISEK